MIQKYTEDKTNEILGYNTYLVGLRKDLEEKRDEATHTERDAEDQIDLVISKALEASQLTMACENIFRRLVERSKLKYKKTTTTRQLQNIGLILEDYKHIIEDSVNFVAAKKPEITRKNPNPKS